jgi:hypothetical protein
MTATEAALSTAPAAASADTGNAGASADTGGTPNPVANPTAPMHYTVKKGDTLWGIASMYLKDPWLWPEVWIINPQVPNPHLIYPGDKLALAYGAGGRMEVRLEEAGLTRLDPRLRSDPLQNAIPTIPYSAIAAFLSRPTLMSSDEVRHAPYVLAFRDMHQVAGNDIEVYIKNLQAAENSRFAVIHIATELRDPDDGKVLGYEGIYTGTALVKRSGEIRPARRSRATGSCPPTTTCRSTSPRPCPARRSTAISSMWSGAPISSGSSTWSRSIAASVTASSPAPCSPSIRRATWCAICTRAAVPSPTA